jgi:hypothetical protein
MNPGQARDEQKIILSGLIFKGRTYPACLNTLLNPFKEYADMVCIFSIAKGKKIMRCSHRK